MDSILKITLVMPVLNEGKGLQAILSRLALTGNEELIVVDGGSTDETTTIAKTFTDKLILSRRGRACQMNAGAEKATGDALLFLHADCVLPRGGFNLIRNVLGDREVTAGAFDIKIDHPGLSFRVIEKVANLRSRLTAVPYGDQALFMRRETFLRIGGFADLPLMEDIEMGRQLKKIGRVVFLKTPVITSARRWLQEGIVYTTLRDWWLAFSFTVLKRSPAQLLKYYRDIR